MKAKWNAPLSVALGLPLSAVSTALQTQGKKSPASLGPPTDHCLMLSFSPGGSCLAVPRLGSWILLH